MPRPRAGEWLQDEMRGLAQAGLDTVVSLLTAPEIRELDLVREAEHCEAAGLQFLSFPIPDRGVPASAADLRAFVRSLADQVRAGRKLGIHCRAGIGRSGLVAACVLSDLGVATDALFPMLGKARRIAVPDTPEQEAWVRSFIAGKA
ncbi:cyclin-dependent kinase inhibitor 3 (CDKN3) [Panacagrimonas perspica]|uniref:Cyclin-dependent kinase inhibitor 3 (CDKN3) n=2 Tax=Panacagrimonas perspica TaxID=381431 RepID=A0A4S3K016_9GAMM|nr:cyclin-dependent kinase inhibitor 3 (CDKN3) [Panacagrimonas perspica]THD01242.1 hypothetical protein B1810_20915 [Panacagrimonas perspica]